MKKNAKLTKKKAETRTKKKVSSLYILVAVVAIIECLALISFTTYSWIETASSLIIKTGHKHYEDSIDSRIPIANALNYKFVINSTAPNDSDISDLNSYFSYSGESSTQNLYRFARASSVDGKTFYFPKKNNLNTSATTYRKGDIIDSNANFTHFDFVVSNTSSNLDTNNKAVSSHKYKFYFKDANVFTVTNNTSNLSDDDLLKIRNAMRISFQTGSGTPVVYGMDSYSANAVDNVNGHTSQEVHTRIQVDPNGQKLFTIGKNSEQNISVRIWIEDKAFGMDSISSADLAGVNIGINLQLTYADNDYDYLYFDDYTFSSGISNKDNIGGSLTADFNESNTHRMYFAYSENGSTYYYYPMTFDRNNTNGDSYSWVTCNSSGTATSTVPDTESQPFITRLTTANSNALRYSYFAYGTYNRSNVGSSTAPSAPLYKWMLNGSPANDSSELRYTGYSVTSTDTASYGVGGWAYNTPLSMVYFRDLATGVTTNDYNTGSNFKYITSAVNVASDDGTGNRSNVMYVNAGLVQLTDALKETQAPQTATMYYDKSADNGNGLFKSWVPSSWLTAPMRFSYCPDGYYANCCVSWYDSTVNPSKTTAANDYIYTALGCSQNYDVAYFSGSVHSGRNDWINPGSGTWREIESAPVYFSTELIDSIATKDHRYQIGVKLDGSSTFSYYHLVPDSTNQKFYAYLPKAGTNSITKSDFDAGEIAFRRFPNYETHTTDAFWLSNAPKGSRTFYPVTAAINTTGATTTNNGTIINEATADYTRGYWNISVIVDGTYEHFFWYSYIEGGETVEGVRGNFSYNTTGHTGESVTYTDITPNRLDEYRWYVPLDDETTVPEYIYYKWEPYTNTVFKYSQKLSDGIFCVITEAPDNTPANAFTTE